MNLAGTPQLLRFILRRDRIRLPVWILAIAALTASQASSSSAFYDSPDKLASYAASVGSNAAIVAMAGPPVGLDTLGGAIIFELSTFAAVVVGLMNLFLVGRHTRVDEEQGRTELVLSTAVGRHAPMSAVLLVALAANAVMGVLVGAVLTSYGVPVTGSYVFGASLAAFGLVVAAVAAVAVQASVHARAATGVAVTFIGAATVIRAAGDVRGGGLSWFSPMGWSQATHPYSGDRWWPLLLSLIATAALVALAFALVGRRDLGAGLVQPRPGRAQAPAALGSPLGLAWRLQRGSVAAWATGIFLMSAAYGSMGDAVEELLKENPEAADWFEGAGAGQLVDAYFAAMTVMTALIVAGFAVASVLRLRGEESAGRIEPVLATPTSRWGLIGSHLSVALAGSAALLALAGLGLGGALALTVSDPSQLPRLAGASMAYLPAVWLVAAATAALVGAAPSLAMLSWAYLSWCFVVAILGEQLRIPQWLRDTSAFEHIPLLPLQEMDVLPLAVVGVVAIALAAVGLTGFRRRDIETA